VTDPLERLVRGAAALEVATGLRVTVIGGVARGVWAAPRATLDVDVLIDSPTVQTAIDHAAAAGLVAVPAEVAGLASSGMTRLRVPDHLRGAVRLDVLAADHPYYVRVIERSRLFTVLGQPIRVAAPEDIILLKVLADRSQDRADVEAIVAAQAGSLDLGLLRREAIDLDLALPEALR
jgi:hypothetical protein